MVFYEDACRARKGFAPQNLSLQRKMALQCVKDQQDKCSIKTAIPCRSLIGLPAATP